MESFSGDRSTWAQKALGYAVHGYTACGLICALLTLKATLQSDYPTAFVWMIVAVLIDATDGPLARKFRVKQTVPIIDGSKLDDIVDYLNYTFVPLLMIGLAGWLPEPAWLWVSVPLVASAFGFSHTGAKEAEGGFFLGFPSYWNIVAFYTAIWFHEFGSHFVLGLILLLSGLTVLPVRFVYPNRAPRWKGLFVGGGVLWLAVICVLIAQLAEHNTCDLTLILTSMIYPVFYFSASAYLDVITRASRNDS